MVKPVSLQRPLVRFFCTFLPFVVPPRAGVTAREHWEKYPTTAFEGIEPASQILMDEVMGLMPDRQAEILDMGCNVGRHLNYLFEHGYRKLMGVDFSSQSIRDMMERYPEMACASKISTSSFQDYLAGTPARVDLVYTRGATFELIHPSFPLVRKICAIARKYVVLVIAEAGHSYPRFWIYEFSREGFELIHLRRMMSARGPGNVQSLLVFERLQE